jgi:hypothetical protein
MLIVYYRVVENWSSGCKHPMPNVRDSFRVSFKHCVNTQRSSETAQHSLSRAHYFSRKPLSAGSERIQMSESRFTAPLSGM